MEYKMNDMEENRTPKTQRELRNEKWRSSSSDVIFSESQKRQNINDLKNFMEECNKRKEPVSMQIGNLSISIDEKNADNVYFSVIGERDGLSSSDVSGKYPYYVIIKGDNISSNVKFIKELKYATYRNSEMEAPLKLEREVSIINGKAIEEAYIVRSKVADEIIEEVLQENPQYIKGNSGEFFRTGIQPEEKINHLIHSEGDDFESTDFQAGFYQSQDDYVRQNQCYDVKYADIEEYGEGIEKAKVIEEHCRYIYSLIMQAYYEMRCSKLSDLNADIDGQIAELSSIKGK